MSKKSSSSTPHGNAQRRKWLPAFAIAALIIIAYLPIYQAGYVWDDDEHVTNNLLIEQSSFLSIWQKHAFYYPLTDSAWWVMRRFWGLNPFGYHLANVLLHAINAILLWLVLRRLSVPGAWFGAVLWGLHPVQVQSVAWITELKNCLSGMFYLASLLAWTASMKTVRRSAFYVISLILFLLAVLSKSSTIVLAAILPIITLRMGRKIDLKEILRWIPFWAVVLITASLTIQGQHGQVTMEGGAEWDQSFLERITLAGRAFWFYLGKIIWPFGLSFVYPQWTPVTLNKLMTWLPAMAFILMWMVFLFAYIKKQKQTLSSLYAWLYVCLALAPVLGFFKIYYQRYSWVADHWQYLASMGAVAWLVALLTRFEKKITYVLVGLLMILTMHQSTVYQSEKKLWQDTLEKNPSSWMALNNYGIVLIREGRMQEATEQFEKSLLIKPDHYEIYLNLGKIAARSGEFDQAVLYYKKAIEQKPDYASAYNGLGIVLDQMKRHEDAVTHIEKAIEIKPYRAEYHSNLGNILFYMKRFEKALLHQKEALRLRPGISSFHSNLGITLSAMGRYKEAMRHYQDAIRIQPANTSAHFNLGRTLEEQGHLQEAAEQYRKVLRINPRISSARYQLGLVLQAMGRYDEAIKQYQILLKMNPKDQLVLSAIEKAKKEKAQFTLLSSKEVP